MMSRPNRRILVAAALTSSLLFHLAFCGWAFGTPNVTPAFAYSHFAPSASGPSGGWLYYQYGIIARGSLPGPVAAVFGVIVPVNLLFLVAFLSIHWRERIRSLRAQCHECGHPLSDAERCPECGTQRELAAAQRSAA